MRRNVRRLNREVNTGVPAPSCRGSKPRKERVEHSASDRTRRRKAASLAELKRFYTAAVDAASEVLSNTNGIVATSTATAEGGEEDLSPHYQDSLHPNMGGTPTSTRWRCSGGGGAAGAGGAVSAVSAGCTAAGGVRSIGIGTGNGRGNATAQVDADASASADVGGEQEGSRRKICKVRPQHTSGRFVEILTLTEGGEAFRRVLRKKLEATGGTRCRLGGPPKRMAEFGAAATAATATTTLATLAVAITTATTATVAITTTTTATTATAATAAASRNVSNGEGSAVRCTVSSGGGFRETRGEHPSEGLWPPPPPRPLSVPGIATERKTEGSKLAAVTEVKLAESEKMLAGITERRPAEERILDGTTIRPTAVPLSCKLPQGKKPATTHPPRKTTFTFRGSVFPTPDHPTLPGIKGNVSLASAPPLLPPAPSYAGSSSSLACGLSPNLLKALDCVGSRPRHSGDAGAGTHPSAEKPPPGREPCRHLEGYLCTDKPLLGRETSLHHPELYPSTEKPCITTRILDTRPPLQTLAAAAAAGEGPPIKAGDERSAVNATWRGAKKGVARQKTTSSRGSCRRRAATVASRNKNNKRGICDRSAGTAAVGNKNKRRIYDGSVATEELENKKKRMDDESAPVMPYWRRRRETLRGDSNREKPRGDVNRETPRGDSNRGTSLGGSNLNSNSAVARRRGYFASAAGGMPGLDPEAAEEAAAAAAEAEAAAAAAEAEAAAAEAEAEAAAAAAAAAVTVPGIRYGIMQQRQFGGVARQETKNRKLFRDFL